MTETTMTGLADWLALLIPACLAELATLKDSDRRAATVREWHARARGVTDDDLLRLTTRAEAALDLAHGLAVLACVPGGVRAADRLWCARHHPSGSTAAHCAECLDAKDTRSRT